MTNAATQFRCRDFRTRALPIADDANEYQLHQQALQWSLLDPIIIRDENDIQSRVHWEGRLEPFAHQIQNLITYCRRLPVTLLADDVGLGKTISAGLVLSELMTRRRVSRCLVVAPNILGPQWVEELGAKFGITAINPRGKAELLSASKGLVPVVVTTYESFSRAVDQVDPNAFDMAIFDEAHKLRNLHGSPKPPKMAERVKDALVARRFKYVAMLTATPIQNRVWDLYTLIDLLTAATSHRNPLGSPDSFKSYFIADGSVGREIVPGKREAFKAILRRYIARTRREDAKLQFPERTVRLHRCKPSVAEEKLLQLVRPHFHGIGALLQSSIGRALFSSPQALAKQLEQSKTLPEAWGPVSAAAREIADSRPITGKLRGLKTLVDQLRQKDKERWRLVVFTIRKETQAAIAAALEQDGISFGLIQGGQPAANQRTIERFRSDPPQVNVVVSTDAGAEGVNLQSGNVLVNYDLPWNPMVVEQRIGRIQRLGSAFASVEVVNLVTQGSVEEKVVARLLQKLQIIVHTVGDIECILETTAANGRDEEESFEAQLRRLVVDAMRGQDVEAALKKQTDSIERARDLLEEHRETIDKAMGGKLDDLHTTGPTAPSLTSTRPDRSHHDFVLAHYEAIGAQVEKCGRGLWVAHIPGAYPEQFVFDEKDRDAHATSGVFHGRAPKLYQPGKRDFERLVQRWVDHAGQHVIDGGAGKEVMARACAEAWLAKFSDTELRGCEVKSEETFFHGEVTCKAVAANGLDSYEKLITVPVTADGATNLPDKSALATQKLVPSTDPRRISNQLQNKAVSTIEADSDLREFARFYAERLDEELKSAAPGRAPQIRSNYEPLIHGEAVGVAGYQAYKAELEVEFSIEGNGNYRVTLQAVPACNLVTREPEIGVCQASKRRVPVPCLSTCEISRKRILKHLLVKSEKSGREAWEQHAARCEETGRLLLSDEMGISVVSRAHVDLDLLRPCVVSGEVALQRELQHCEVTGACTLPNELRVSAVSGRKYRSDQSATSAVSGKEGHRSEFVECGVTGKWMLLDEAVVSDVSGRHIREDESCRSSKPPHRIGARSESVRCEVSGAILLKDEAAKCEITGKVVDKELLQMSENSRRLALAEHVELCQRTWTPALADELERSAVSNLLVRRDLLLTSPVSGRRALPEEMKKCELTEQQVLPDELIKSEVSCRLFRKDEKETSQLSGRVGHKSEAVRLLDGRLAWADEVAKSAVSGKVAPKSDFVASEKTGRLALPVETRKCQLSGLRLLEDEVTASAISGKLVDRERLASSDASGRLALPEETESCAATGRRLLFDEIGSCCVTGARVGLDQMAASDVSGRQCRQDLITKCAVSGKIALPDELVRCEITKDCVLPSHVEVCARSGMSCRRDRMVQSAVSGIWLAPAAAIKTAVGAKWCAPDEAVTCGWTRKAFLPSQTLRCRLTGLHIAKKHANRSGELAVLRELLDGKGTAVAFDGIAAQLDPGTASTLGKIKRAWVAAEGDGAACVVVGECGSFAMRLIGARPKRFGFLSRKLKPLKPIGRLCVGKLTGNEWVPDQ